VVKKKFVLLLLLLVFAALVVGGKGRALEKEVQGKLDLYSGRLDLSIYSIDSSLSQSSSLLKTKTEYLPLLLGESEYYILTDKIQYSSGEKVSITFGSGNLSDPEIIISSGIEEFVYLGLTSKNISFTPAAPGNYTIKLVDKGTNSLLASAIFYVSDIEPEGNVKLMIVEKHVFAFGEEIIFNLSNLYQEKNLSGLDNSTLSYSLIISSDKESFGYLGQLKPQIQFIPKSSGYYEASLTFNDSVMSSISFYVSNETILLNQTNEIIAGNLTLPISTGQQDKFTYLVNNEATIEVDFTEHLEKRSILFWLFRLDRIDEMSAYIENYEQSPIFTLSLTKTGVDRFEIKVTQTAASNESLFILRAIGKTSEQTINLSIPIKSDYYAPQPVNVEENVTEITPPSNESAITNISSNQTAPETSAITKPELAFVDFSFNRTEPVNITFDLGEFRIKPLTVFDLTFKNPTFETISVFVEGHNNDSEFRMALEHLELDKFQVTIEQNEKIAPDIYVLFIKASNNDVHVSKRIPFNWGLSDIDEIKEKSASIKKSILVEIINRSNQKIDNISLSGNQSQISAPTLNTTQTISQNLSKNLSRNLSTNPSLNISQNISDQENKTKLQAALNKTEIDEFLNISMIPELKIEGKNHAQLNAEISFFSTDGKLIDRISNKKVSPLQIKPQARKALKLGRYDVEIATSEKSIRLVRLRNFSYKGNLSISFDDVAIDNLKIWGRKAQNAFSINFQDSNFSDGELIAKAKGTELYKCKDWNFESQSCFGSWQKIADIIPGMEYSIPVEPGDPGYAETGVASINTKKSIYHPGETAGLIMVVLDTSGHLVSGADVYLNITDPNNSTVTFSTGSGNIFETDRGIYEASYSATSIEGNYSLSVSAHGANIDSNMHSFFAVKNFYSFDILRSTPVTTDPFVGPFTTSIKITSLGSVVNFGFSEFLPIDFTVIDAHGASESIVEGKKVLFWPNLNNNSEVSYSALPPLVTPELWDIGPSSVSYSAGFNTETFEEARSWYLAVDPLNYFGNALFAYGIASDNPQYRNWSSSALSGAGAATSLGANPDWIELARSSNGKYIVMGTIDEGNTVDVQVWDGSGWGSVLQVGSAGDVNFKGMDVAFESNTGRGMIAYRDGTNIPKYQIWTPASGWGGEQSALNTGSEVRWVELSSDPSTNYLAMGTLDNDTADNSDINVQIWNGTGWKDLQEVTTDANDNYKNFDLEWSIAGYLLVIHGDDDNEFAMYSTYNRTSATWPVVNAQAWTVETGTGTDLAERWMELSASNLSDVFVGIAEDNENDIYYGQFSGGANGAWTGTGQATGGSGSSAGFKGFDFAFESLNDAGIMVYSEGNANIRFRTWTIGGGIDGTEQNIMDIGNEPVFTRLASNPNSDEILLITIDAGSDSDIASWSGSAWTDQGEIVNNGITDTRMGVAVVYGGPFDLTPTVTLNYPSSNYYNDSTNPSTIIFNCSVIDDDPIINISLYLSDNLNVSFRLNDTCAPSIANTSCAWTKSMGIGNYTWNCLAYDTFNFTDWADNRSLKLNYTPDLTLPTIVISIDNSTPITGQRINITANVTDNKGLSTCMFFSNDTIDGNFIVLNKTVSGSSAQCSQNFTISAYYGRTINFTVIVNDTSQAVQGGNINSSQLLITVIALPPNISSVLCAANGGGYANCRNLAYMDTLNSVRAACNSTSFGQADNISFIMTNIIDNKVYFNTTITSSTDGYWIYNANGIRIEDSGTFNLKTICRENPITQNDTNFTISFGNLTAVMINPTVSTNASQNKSFIFSANVSCTGGECGWVNATLNYTNVSTGGVIPMNAGSPFFSFTQNPMNWTTTACLVNMSGNSSCLTSWTLNATGITNSTWRLSVRYNAFNYTTIAANITARVNITIIALDENPPVVNITFPLNNSIIANPAILNASTSENAICKYSTNSSFYFNNSGILFNGTGFIQHGASLGSIAEGSYTYYIKCNDTSGNINTDQNQGRTSFRVDSTPPNVTLNFPNDEYFTESPFIRFNWTASDNLASSMLCNLSLDNVFIAINQSSINNTPKTYDYSVSEGIHLWNVICSDNVSNTYISFSKNFSYSLRKVFVSVQTQNQSYKQYQNVSLFSPITFRSTDQESGAITALPSRASYSIFFEDFDNSVWSTTALANPSLGCSGGYGLFNNCADNGDYQFARSGGGYHISDGYLFVLDDWDNFNSTAGIWYSFNSFNTCGGRACQDVRATGYIAAASLDNNANYCNVWARNNTGTRYMNITVCPNEGICEFSETDEAMPDDVSDWIFFNNSMVANLSMNLTSYTAVHIGGRAVQADEECYFEDIGITGLGWQNDSNYTSVEYTAFGGQNYTKISDIDVAVQVSSYSATASAKIGNNYPDLEVSLYNGTEYKYKYRCNLTAMYGTSGSAVRNCSYKVLDAETLLAWNSSSNRRIRVNAVYLDGDSWDNDTIAWTGVFAEVETPSKLENYGNVDHTGRLVFEVQNFTNDWTTMAVFYNSSQTIGANSTLNLSSLNSNWFAGVLDLGTYRLYSSFRYENGSMIQNLDRSYINDTYLFRMDYLKLTVQSPINNTIVDATHFWANVTLNYSWFASGGYCVYSLDSGSLWRMQNDSSLHFFNYSSPTTVGRHNVTFSCNDTTGDFTNVSTSFNATDQSGPIINLEYPTDALDGLGTSVVFRYNLTDPVSGILNCSIYIDSNFRASNSSVQEGISQNFTVSSISAGTHDWRIECYDDSPAINFGESDTYDFTVGSDSAPPDIFLGDPQNHHVSSTNDVVFYFGVYDELSNIANCSLILNNTINATKTTADIIESFESSDNNFTVNDMNLGTYNWSINCTDLSSSRNVGASSTRNLTIIQDTDYPNIALLAPDEGAQLTSQTVDFTFNVTDDSSAISNCSVIINGTVNSTKTPVTESVAQTITVNGFVEGFYIWNITCIDNSFQANRNYSLTRNFSISLFQNLLVRVIADKAIYQQGNQVNETVNISTLVSDVLANPLNSSVVTDVISGNTSLSWWNSSWKKRIPIYINESRGVNRTNEVVLVNVTGLGSSLESCRDGLRIIMNDSIYHKEIPFSVLDGDDSTYCTVKFKANLTGGVVNDNRFYAYYNGSPTSNPNYAVINNVYNVTLMFEDFEGTGWENISDEDPASGCANGSGTNFNNCLDNGDYQFARSDAGEPISPLSELVVEDWDVFNSSAGIWYEFDPQSSCVGPCNDFRVSGYISASGLDDDNEFCRVFIKNSSSEQYTTVGSCNNEDQCEFSEGNSGVPLSANNYTYFNATFISNYSLGTSTTSIASVHIGARVPQAEEQCFFDDIKVEALSNITFQVSTSVGSSQQLYNSSANNTGDDGSYLYSIPSSILPNYGYYSLVLFASATGYTSNRNFTIIRVIADNGAPIVQLVGPPDNNISVISNITFYYNVTDNLSSIVSCTLILNNSLNMTNTSISENAPQNFSLNNLRNGDYNWTVNCTDGSSSPNTGFTSTRRFNIASDTIPPVISIVAPPNGWNDTNGNMTFNITLSDATSTADCDLYINSQLNASLNDVSTSGSLISFPVNNFSEGNHTWYVNCTDDSIARNSNISQSRNFSVNIDRVPPEITIFSPAVVFQSTSGNVSFVFNVTDALSKVASCSLIINSSVNRTNSTINTAITQNFTLVNIATGFYQWKINCTDSSEFANTNSSDLRNLSVATDMAGPVVSLEFPPPGSQFTNPNVTFRYNVTDFASSVANCTLIINNTRNLTNSSIVEGASLNFTLNNLGNGDYNWSVNCTDTSANENVGNSSERSFTIGIDQTPPDISLTSPPNNTYTDTNGIVTFFYSVSDLASAISNCSILIDGSANQSNASIVESDSYQNFSVKGLNTAIHNWSISCFDSAVPSNRGNSTTFYFNVTLDTAGPSVKLESPSNNSMDTNGNLVFTFNVSDDISGITNCSVFINGVKNQTNTSFIQENAAGQSISVNNFNDGNYTWYVHCIDNSENLNANISNSWNVTVQKDTSGPQVYLEAPPNGTKESDGIRTFYYNVSDDISGIANCRLMLNGAVAYTNTSVVERVSQNFTINTLTTQNYTWNVTCTDNSENSNVNSSRPNYLPVRLDTTGPIVNLTYPLNDTQSFDSNLIFYYIPNDTVSGLSNCSLYLNGTLNQTNQTFVAEGQTNNFSINGMSSGDYFWSVQCTDDSEIPINSSSQTRFLKVGSDSSAPVVSLESPSQDQLIIDNFAVFKYSVSDYASNISNCSIFINNVLNKTNSTITEGISQNFTVTGFTNDDYYWQVNCTDNAAIPNTGNSSSRNFTIGTDVTGPNITLISPSNNTRLLVDYATLIYNVTDLSSGLANCSLRLDGVWNKSNATSVNESIFNNISISGLSEGSHSWVIECYDDSLNYNIGQSAAFNISYQLPDTIYVNVTENSSSVEQGRSIMINVTTVDQLAALLPTTLKIDIIRANATASWWNSSWHYRIPVDLNTTNSSRRNELIELPVDFTTVITNDLGLVGKRFDENSTRVVEWHGNSSIEVISELDKDAGYDALSSATGVVRWILNGTSNNTVRRYYVYFDTLDNRKTSPAYPTPVYSLNGSTKAVNFNGSSTSAERLTLRLNADSITVQFGDGAKIPNQDNVDYPGAGSLTNITVNNSLLMNPHSALAPLAVKSQDYLFANATVVVEPGPVTTKIRIISNISTINPSVADLNYTIWFTNSEIHVKGELYALFGESESSSSVRYQNLWFAYLLHNLTNWEDYLYESESDVANKTFAYKDKTPSGSNTLLAGSWYALRGQQGSLNVLSDKFEQNGVNKSKGLILFNDGYDTAPESDTAGFNFDETSISAGTAYSLRIFAIASANKTSERSRDIEKSVNSPIEMNKLAAEEWMNTTTANTGSSGRFNLNWSTTNRTTGWYTSIALANRTFFNPSLGWSRFEIGADTVSPIVALVQPSGWRNSRNLSFNYTVSDNNLVLSNCTLILNDAANLTNYSITNGATNRFYVDNLYEGKWNWTANCSDPAGNIGTAAKSTFYVDVSKPQVQIYLPVNNSNLTSSTVTFNLSTIDNLDDNISCSIRVNGSVMASVNATNQTNTSVSIPNILQGTNYWNVTCTDEALNSNTSVTWRFTANLAGTVITLVSPKSPNYWDSDGDVLFVYSPTSIGTILNCSLFIDSIFNRTNSSINNGNNNNFSVAGIREGNHNWSVNCTDESFTRNSTVEAFIVDLTPPGISHIYPGPGALLNESSITFNFSVVDNFDSQTDCNISIDGLKNNTASITAQNITGATYTPSGINDGFHYWNVTCKDQASNQNTSITSNFTVDRNPIVSLVDPLANSWTLGNISFKYSVSENGGIANCSLFINNQYNLSNQSYVTNNAVNNFTLTNIAEGNYTWNVSCIDARGNIGAGAERRFFVDRTKPSINLSGPLNNALIEVVNVDFNFTVFDNFDNSLTCNLTIDSTVSAGNSLISVSNGTLKTKAVSGLSDGDHYWNVTCWDHANNTNSSPTWKLTSLVPPVISLISPDHNAWNSSTTMLFYYNASDVSGISNCSLFFDGVFNMTNSTPVINSGINNFSLSNINQGYHNWSIHCMDVTNTEQNSSTRTLYIDTQAPSITLNYPSPGEFLNVSSLALNFTASDNLDDFLECNVTLDSQVNNTGYLSAQNNTPKTHSLTGLIDGIHYWNVTCRDEAKNAGFSQSINFTISSPPTVYIIQPPDNHWVTAWNLSFYYNVTDNSAVSQCALILNNIINKTNNTVINRANNNFSVTMFNEGYYNWSVNCTDPSGNTGNSSQRIFAVDRTPPGINLSTPVNYSSIAVSLVDFNFSSYDNLASNLSCNLTLDGSVLAAHSKFNVSNGSLVQRQVSGIGDGSHSWNVTCWDFANNTNTSQTRIFNALIAPTVALFSPDTNTWNSSSAVTFFYNVSDLSGISNCSLIFDTKLNVTNSTIINVNQRNNLSLSGIIDGLHNWTVNCTDSTGVVGNASLRNIYVDTTRPNISLNAPTPGQVINTTSYTFNFTAYDNLDSILDCNLTLDGRNNNTVLITADNSIPETFGVVGLNDGTHFWNVSCADEARNSNTSSTNNFTIGVIPQITIISPESSYWSSTGNVTFIYNVSDNTDVRNCTLVILGSSNKTNSSILINRLNNFTLDNMVDGVFNWTVNCSDTAGNSGTDQPYLFYVDRGPPSINLTGPVPGTIFSSSLNISMNFSVQDNLDNILVCNVTINGTVNNSAFISVANMSSYSFNQSGFKDGIYFWNVTCMDNATNTNTSLTYNFSVQEKPRIKLGLPNNNSRSNDQATSFLFTPEDNSDRIANCTVVLNSFANATNVIVSEGVQNGITPANLPHLQYNWTVNCTDYAGNTGTNSSLKIFYLDLLGPGIDLNFPTSGNLNYNDINFNFTALDQFGLSTPLVCNITLDDSVNVSNISFVSGNVNISLIQNLSNGIHYWNVTCKDDLNNSNTSLTASFNVNAPDLAINSSEISFNDTSPSEIDNITISAIVYNIGGVEAENTVVRFYDGNPGSGGIQIGGDYTISILSTAQNISVNVTWRPTIGQHQVYVILDPNNDIDELSENNNNASAFYNVSLYQTVYGNVTGLLVIRNLVNQTVFTWNISQNQNGFVFAIDADSSISWTNLSALGVNTAQQNMTNDFAELDLKLNTSQYNESINLTYTTDSRPRNDTDLVIFSRKIDNVPIVSSSNVSSFYTGILWDVSDDSNGQYDGSEDIIFVSRVNRQQQGAYGTYDFEIKFPSNIRRYIATDQVSVVFYAELV